MSGTPPPPNSDERTLLDRATQFARNGRVAEAERAFADLLRRNPDSVEALAFLAWRAFEQRRFREAADGYLKCSTLRPDSAPFHFNLGTARESLGDLNGAIGAYLDAFRLNPRDWRLALYAGSALEAAGRRNDAAILFTMGDDIDPAMRAAKDQAGAHPALRERSAVADRVMREHLTGLHAKAVAEAELRAANRDGKAARCDLSRVRGAIWIQTHDAPVRYRTPKQEPSLFYVPDLPARAVTPRAELAWATRIEERTAEVRDEYFAAVQSGAQLAPYVDPGTRSPVWQELRGRLDWSALHLFKVGQETPVARLFPRTLEVLEAADIVRLEGNPVELFFSRLRPGAHIPPHFGAANNRLTVHLPLVIPDGCEIRVGGGVHAWREGELFAFDDSFEHEAWNRSHEDRVVLIFESHHPDLSPAERAAIEYTVEARNRWLRERRIPA